MIIARYHSLFWLVSPFLGITIVAFINLINSDLEAKLNWRGNHFRRLVTI